MFYYLRKYHFLVERVANRQLSQAAKKNDKLVICSAADLSIQKYLCSFRHRINRMNKYTFYSYRRVLICRAA